jgi:hypothetical protein
MATTATRNEGAIASDEAKATTASWVGLSIDMICNGTERM